MSLLNINCPNSLSFIDVIRLVTDVDVDGNFYLRVVDDATETEPLAECDGSHWGKDSLFAGMLVHDTSDSLLKLRAKIT